MNRYGFLPLVFLLVFGDVDADEAKSYEIPRTEVVPIQDTRSDRQYELYIKLPDGYAENIEQEYPVIYTTDAIWHFEMLSGATEYLMPNVILVGISWQKDLGLDRPHASRFRDYSVLESTNPEHQATYQFGRASDHLFFIRDNVIRFIQDNYRAIPGERAYFGYSLGSVIGTYTLLAEPDTFTHYILGSPAVDQRSVEYFDRLESSTSAEQSGVVANAFVSIGELEEAEMGVTRDLLSVLRRRNNAGLTLTGLEVIEDSDHGTAFPITVIRGVRWLSAQTGE